ncbi:MAG: hypothetical protein KDA50_00010 [Rhodobacteraceae bacterium]|nr:hypothetical protein [Paracoccaceae bacterium]
MKPDVIVIGAGLSGLAARRIATGVLEVRARYASELTVASPAATVAPELLVLRET